MQLPFLQQLKRFLPFFGLGLSTTLLSLTLSFNPSYAQLSALHTDRPTSVTFIAQGGSGNLAQISQPISLTLDLVQQGKTAYQNGQLNRAVTVWNQAADDFAAQGDRLHQAMTLSYLAQAYQQLGQWDKANPTIAQGLELLKQPTQGAIGERLPILAEAFTIQGSLQFDQGRASEAFTSWQQAANAFQQASDRAGVIRSQINQSQALVTLGLFKRANNLLGELYQKRYEKPLLEAPLQLAILLNYGETLRLVGQLTDAPPNSQSTEKQTPNSIAVLLAGLELAQTLNAPADITAAQMSLGNTYRAWHQLQKRLQTSPCPDPTALQYYQQALNYYQQVVAQTNSPTSKIQALLNQQSLLLPIDVASVKPSVASSIAAQVQSLTTQIQAQLDRLPLSRTALYARIQLAHNLLKIGDSRQAAQLLETSVNQAESLGDRVAQSYALGYLGQAYERQQQGDDAQKLTAQALTLTTKALDLAKTLNAPEIAYRWFWQLGQLEQASEPDRSVQNYRAAYQTLQTFRQNLAADNPDLQFSFRERPIEPVYREFVDLLLQPEVAANKTQQSDQEAALKEARQVIQDLRGAELANFLQEPCAPSNLEAIDNRVDKTDSFTATLYSILLPDRIEVIAKFPQQPLFHYAYPIAESAVREKINQFQLDLQESYTFDAVKQEGQELYQWLIAPIQAQLAKAQIKTIVFALDGSLRNIPMAALHDGQQYLIENYAVAVTLDLEIKDPEPLTKDRLTVLAASLSKPPMQFRDVFATLPQVDRELDAIQQTQGVLATALRDSQFTQESFNQKFEHFPFHIVHLATHGQFSSNPQETFILTAGSQLSDGKVRLNNFDTMFRTRELNRADAIELLILSACETASGDDRATLGIAGTAVQAGARSAIASLWSLDDTSSQKLIATFYQSITQPHTSRAEALRQAQLALLQGQDELYTHPRYWAPFLLVGNWL
jgi:CHAT domain-containing protein